MILFISLKTPIVWSIMSHFIPVNREKAEALESKLSAQIFRSVKDFVEFYNSGLISKKHEDVKEITKEITDTFKDVKEKNGRLVFISEEEVALEETLNALKIWESLVKLKRETAEAIEQKLITENGRLLIDDSGNLNTVHEDNENGEIVLESINSEKVVARKDDLASVIKTVDPNVQYSQQLKGYLVATRNIIELNDSFILQIKELVPNV